MTLSTIKNEIGIMRTKINGTKPHKYIMLLAILDLFSKGKITENKIEYKQPLLDAFTTRFNQFSSTEDKNRPVNPFFHLKSQSFWKLIPKKNQEKHLRETTSIGGVGQLNELVEYAQLSDELFDIVINNASRKELEAFLVQLLQTSHKETTGYSNHETVFSISQSTSTDMPNPFLTYINSLHNLDGHSSGALAEQQACNPFFNQIQVEHSLVDEIYNSLCGTEHRHYILTGHAGDGKSSIALQVYKRFKKIPFEQSLDSGLKTREDFTYNGKKLILIKDLSEWNEQEQDSFFAEMESGKCQYLLISNTGCLLNLFKRHKKSLGKTSIEIENLLLEAMDSQKNEHVSLGKVDLTISNLALQDNTGLALQVWNRMVDADGWKYCEVCQYHQNCPVFHNLQILRKNKEIINERLGHLLRRTQLYGGRLTMRQYCAHFSYMLGSGINSQELIDRLAKGEEIKIDDFLFFNRFFGDAGGRPDSRCTQMQSIEIFKKQGFETRLSAQMEHFLWLQDENTKLKPGIAELEDFYQGVQRIACAENSEIYDKQELQNARKQLRRMFYFLYQPAVSQHEMGLAFEQFKSCFVNSPVLLDYEQWLVNDVKFNKTRMLLTDHIYQVLQEQFSGLRLPEGSQNSGKVLYMTLARRERDIRQSAQIVLGKLNFNDVFILKKSGDKIQLVMKGSQSKVPPLELPLPFLDYIFERKNGDIGTAIQPGFANRLETFKSQLLKEYRQYTDNSALVLIKQTSRNEIKQQRLSLANGKLEVSND